MTDTEILKMAYNKIGRVNAKLIYHIDKPKNAKLKQYLIDRYGDIPDDLFSYKEVLWRISHGIDTRPVCECCGNPHIEFKGFRRKCEPDSFPNGYKRTCCDECSRKLWKEKSCRTVMDKYGVVNVFQSEKVKNRIKKTCLSRYGVENPAQSEIVKEKVENTTFLHYGVRRSLASKECKEKYRATCVTRYGRA